MHRESAGQFADVRMLTGIQHGPESVAAIAEVLPRVGIVAEVRAFKDAEVRRLVREYGAAA